MKAVPWLLIGLRIFALTSGLTVVGIGCGGGATDKNATLTQEEVQRNEETRNAMEAASKASKAAKKK